MKQNHKFRWQHLSVIAIVALFVLSGAYLLSSNSLKSALADSQDANETTSTQFIVKLTKTGYTTGTAASLDRTVNSSGDALYSAGETVVLKWQGVATGNDFIIPVSVKYGTVTKTVTDLISNANFQTLNSEYKRRMSSDGAIAEYDTLKSYLTQEHLVDLGAAIDGLTVNVEYMRVSPVYRMYNMITSEHLFSTNKTEYDNFVAKGKNDEDYWIGEGVNWLAPYSSTTTVQRLYNAALGAMGHSSHYYTSNETEMNTLISQHGWTSDGADNSFGSDGTVAIYTCYNEALGSAHHYTSSKSEWEGLEQHGWALERDKNEPNGNFNGVLGTAWSFDNNFYTVKHNLENLDGTSTLYASSVIAGTANAATEATALTIPGFKAGTIPSATVSADNSTTLDINYTRETYSISFDTQGGSAVSEITGVKYGDKLTAPTTSPTKDGQALKNWSFDKAGVYTVDFANTLYTMPVGGVTLYAQYEAKNSTDGNGQLVIVDPTTNKNLKAVVSYNADDSADTSTLVVLSDAVVKVDESGNVSVQLPAEASEKTVKVELTYEDATSVGSKKVTVFDAGQTTGRGSKQATSGSVTFAYYNVVFDTQNGSTIDKQKVYENKKATKPASEPEKQGYHFKGWVTSADGETLFDFDNTAITQDTTIYAKFQAGTVAYKVELYQEGETEGQYSDTPSKTVEAFGTTGEQTKAESIEHDAGYELDATKGVVNTTITADGNAVAKVYLKRKAYALKFDKGDIEESELSSLTGWPQDNASKRFGTSLSDVTEPYSDLYILEGWYTDAERTNKIDTAKFRMPAADTTLYAKWTKNANNRYTANFYVMKEDGTYDTTIDQTKVAVGEVGKNTDTSPWANAYQGYHIDTEKTETKQVTADGKTVINVYFARNKITVTYVTKYDESGKLEAEKTAHTVTALYGTKLSDPTKGDQAVAIKARGLLLEKWMKDGFEEDSNTNEWNFDVDTIPALEDGATLKLYAKWKGKEVWIGPASKITTGNTTDTAGKENSEYDASKILDNIKKTADELNADVAVLRAGKEANETEYNKVLAEYTDFMNKDNFHLYTYWVGSTTDSSNKEQEENKYLEFRIIHVGDHDGDGSVLTFQMTHLIPTAYNISDTTTTTNGWAESPLRAKIAEFAAKYETFAEEFKEIEKKCFVGGSGESSSATTSTKDKFWLTSIYEMIPSSDSTAQYEGSQYAWFKDKIKGEDLIMSKACPALAFKTRAGNAPLGSTDSDSSYWTRTPDRKTNTAQTIVMSNGQIYNHGLPTKAPNELAGVVISFAL